MASINTYIPLGHGREITIKKQNGSLDYDIKIIPDGCYYITMAISGEKNLRSAHDVFFDMLKNRGISLLFNDIISNFPQIKLIFDTEIDRKLKPEQKGTIELNLRLPGETYVDVKYRLFLDFEENDEIYKSGLYDLNYIQDNINLFGKKLTTKDKKDRLETTIIPLIYDGSLLPTPDFFNKLIDQSRAKVDVKQIKDILKYWPFYINFEKTGMFKNVPGSRQPKTFKDLCTEFFTSITNEDEEEPQTFIEIEELLKSSDTSASFITLINTYKTFIRKLYNTIQENINEGKDNVDELITKLEEEGLRIEMQNIFRQLNARKDQPGPLTQSYLFNNFPGIHINMACRSLPEDFPKERRNARRRNSINSRTRWKISPEGGAGVSNSNNRTRRKNWRRRRF